MKTIEITLYQFQELSKDAKQKAIDNNRDINIDYEWWNCTYDDAENIGLEIKSFDTYRRGIETELSKPVDEIINIILVEHGKDCNTYKVAQAFKKQVSEIVNKGLQVDDQTQRMFKDSLSEQYINMLQTEYEYLISDEVIGDSLTVNEYDFTESGEMYHV